MLELAVYQGEERIVLQFEHSLLALSKWESRTKKAFLSTPTKTSSEMIDYYQDMLLGDSDPDLVYSLSPEQMDRLTEYINDPMTASSVPPAGPGVNAPNEIVTSELIYYQMTALRIPFVAETWHLTRLLMLIAITAYKSQPPDKNKRSKAETMADWRQINERRLKKYNTTG